MGDQIRSDFRDGVSEVKLISPLQRPEQSGRAKAHGLARPEVPTLACHFTVMIMRLRGVKP